MRTNAHTGFTSGLVFALAATAAAQGPTDFAADRAPPAAVRAATLQLPAPAPAPVLPLPAPGKSGVGAPVKSETLPIDLASALRLANVASPTIAIAQTRVREALARVDQADALRLPTLSGGGFYLRHDGIDQNRRAELFTVSRGSLFLGGGAALRVDLAEAIYQPLVARRLADAEAAAARGTTNSALLDVASAYFDLVQANAALEINADILERAEQILKAARAGDKQGLNKTAADVNRAETEVSQRRVERLDLQARAGVASARLVRLLNLDPATVLVPADAAAVPIDLFATDTPVSQLVDLALSNRPELAAAMSMVEAADLRARQARYSPFIPRLQAEYLNGGFGGGKNGTISNLENRGDLSAQIFWELRGLGLGNLSDMRLRDAERDRAVLTAVAARAQVAAEVVEAAKVTAARRASFEEARKAVDEAREMYRKLSATSFGMIGPRGQFDALEPLLAVTALSQARIQQLAALVEYNRSQFRLLTAVGQPPDTAAASKVVEPKRP